MEDELQHYGILGMKWGVRRFQNPDGSLTKAGEKRYGNADGEKKVWSTSKKIAVGVGISLGTAAVAAGGAYLAKKAGINLSSFRNINQSFGQQFANEVSKEFGSIENLVSKRAETANIADKTRLDNVKSTVSSFVDKISAVYDKKAQSNDPETKENAARQLEALRKQFDYYVKLNSESLARTNPSESILTAIGVYASPDAAKLVRTRYKSG